MSSTVEQYLAEYKMDRRDYVQGANEIIRTNKKVRDSQEKLEKPIKIPAPQVSGGKGGSSGGIGAMFEKEINLPGLSSANRLISGYAAGVAALGTAYLGTAFAASVAAADFDSLVKSLEAVDGSSKEAQKSLADLKNLAKQPGLGFEEGVRAYVGLRNADLDRGFSEKLISEFANANARAGGGKETFDRIMMAVRQIAVSPNLRGQDLMQLNEANLPVQLLLKKHFGTGDSEELTHRGVTSKQALEGLVAELEKLPRVSGGAKNSLDNLSDAIKFAFVDFGMGVNSNVLGNVDKSTDIVTQMTEAGVFKDLGETVSQALLDVLHVDDMTGLLREIVYGVDLGSIFLRNIAMNVADMAHAGSSFLNLVADVTTFGATAYFRKQMEKQQKDDAPSPFDEAGKNQEARDAKMMANAIIGGDVDRVRDLGGSDHDVAQALRNKKKQDQKKAASLGDQANNHVNNTLGKIETNTRKSADVLQKQFDRTQSIIGGSRIGGKGITSIELAGLKRMGGAHHKIKSAVMGMIQAIYEYAAESADNHQLYNLRGAYAD